MRRINSLDDLETVVPEEVPRFPGFFYYPDSRWYAVSKDAIVIDSKTGRKIGIRYDQRYADLHIQYPDGTRFTQKLHRVVARTFVGRPTRHLDKDYSDLEINHWNGDRKNNSPDNLEWVTSLENTRHCFETGLHSSCKPVYTKNIHTGEEGKFYSLSNCADHFGVAEKTFQSNMYDGTLSKYHIKGWVFKLDEKKPWTDFPLYGPWKPGVNRDHFGFEMTCVISGHRFTVGTIRDVSNKTGETMPRVYRLVSIHPIIQIGNYYVRKM